MFLQRDCYFINLREGRHVDRVFTEKNLHLYLMPCYLSIRRNIYRKKFWFGVLKSFDCTENVSLLLVFPS